jgi:hypothetical protein
MQKVKRKKIEKINEIRKNENQIYVNHTES